MSILSFFVISLFVLSGVFLGIVAFFYIKINREEDISWNDVLINLDNHVPIVLGVVNDIKEGRGGRSLIFFTKRGEIYKLISNNYLSLKNKSDDRGVVLNLPKYSEDLNKKIKESPYFSEKFSNIIENKNINDIMIKVLRESNLRKDELSELVGGGELSKTFIQKLLKLVDLENTISKESIKDKKIK